MKYRRLDVEELQEMEKEFVRFLATRSIPGPDWEKMKTTQPDRVNELLDEFSDLVFEKILTGINYLEMKTPSDLKTFKCGKEKIELLGISVEGNSQIDFTKDQTPEEMIAQFKSSSAQLKMYQAEKGYKGNRELELFSMMESGCLISEGGMFMMLRGVVGR